MSNPGEFKSQLEELTVQLCGMVSEKLYMATRDMEPVERSRIIYMIEDQLPTVITNSIAKTPSLHSSSGVDYLSQNLETWADSFSRKFLSKD